MLHPWIARTAGALAVAIGLLATPAAQAQRFVASPSIPDTTATSACTSPCALRQAIAAAEAAEEAAVNGFKTETQTIELPVGTYTLTNGPLRIKHKYGGEPEGLTLTLQGLGARADEVVITAAGKSRVLVDGNFGGTSGAVVLKRLEITGGNGAGGIEPEEPLEPEKGEGGAVAIEQNGTLELDEVLVTGNTAASAGGGVEDDGELAVQASTIAHNTVTGGLGLGGGLSSENPNSFSHELVTVVNSTIADNSVSGGSTNEGGAIYAGSILKLTNSTLSGNSAPGNGGTLATGGEATSTIANNIIAYDKGRACAGTNPTSLGGNDVADVGCELANQKKTNDISADPGLEKESAEAPKLADNGGPTETIAIADALSPPVKNGLQQYCPASDQRGAERPAGNNCSAGAYQYGAKPGAIISASVTPHGAGVVSAKSAIAEAECSEAQCTVPAQASGKVNFSEVPSSGFGFAEWIGCSKIVAGECEVENDGANQSVTAKFLARFAVTAATATQETKVSATASGAAAVCAATSCTVDEGEAATLTAESSDPGLQFVGWSGGSCATQNPCKLEHVKGTETDTASFELGPPSSPPGGTAYAYFDAEAPSEGDGTKQAPFRSTRALEPLLERREEEIFHEHGEVSPLELLFAGGEYEGLEFNGAKEISVYGDLNPSTWKAEREPSNPTRFVGRPQGLLLNGSTEMSFQQVSFRGEPGAGGSVYGVRMIDKAHATFADVHASAGNAPAGANGAPGASGNPGAKGVAGAEGHTPGQEFCVKLPSPGCDAGYLGGNAAGGDGGTDPEHTQGAVGGAGGLSGYSDAYLHENGQYFRECTIAECPQSSPHGTPGSAGGSTPAGPAGGGGEGGTRGCTPTNSKGDGGSGSAGGAGVGGQTGHVQTEYQLHQEATWNPSYAGSGAVGSAGGGGGGGGAGCGGTGLSFEITLPEEGAGDSGGGGGGGGGPGDGGQGGSGGGGSFGFFITSESTATIGYASHLEAAGGGRGGNGGPGGAGGAGGQGGEGGVYEQGTIGTGGNAGSGGSGGGGGGGGGGTGGPSYAIYEANLYGAKATISEDTVLVHGEPGPGGSSLSAGGTPVATGSVGKSGTCTGCKVSSSVPNLPVAAKISGGTVITTIECPSACTGTAWLVIHGKLKAKHGKAASLASVPATQIGSAAFKLKGRHAAVLRILNCLNFHRNIGHPNVLDQQDQLGLLRYQEAGGGGLIAPANVSGAVVAPTDLAGNGGAPATFVQKYEVDKILGMVRRDRSHPSLVIYCIANETQYALTNPQPFWLYDQIRQIDPSRIVYLHSGIGAPDQLAMLPYTTGTNFLVENGHGYSGYNDQHNVGGPGNYQDSLYLNANNYGLYTTNTSEILVWGEMYGVGMPDDHQAIVNWYQTNGVDNTGYDLAVHQQALAAYNTFLDKWGFRSSFPTASSLFYEIGKKSYFFWQKMIEDGRMCDANDSLVISGWESTDIDNHSGLVDVFRDFRTDPSILKKAMNPEVLVIRPKRFVLKPGDTANVDVHLINEVGRSGPQTLTITALNPDGSVLFTTQRSVTVAGGDVFGQVLVTNLTFVPTTNGTVCIDGTIQPNGGTGDVFTNETDLLVVDPTVGTPIMTNVVVCEGSNQISSTLSNVFNIKALNISNLNSSVDAIVMSPAPNSTWSFSTYNTTATIANTSDSGLFQNQMYGPVGTVGSWYGFAPGNVTVQLCFAETYFTATNDRVFDVALNGTTVLTNFDIFKVAGEKNIAVTETFTVNATNGSILLSIPKIEQNNAQIAAIKMTDANNKVTAVVFSSGSFTDHTGQVWQPYVNSLVPLLPVTGPQWQMALNQVYSNGVRLVLWPNAINEAMLFVNQLAASNIVSIVTYNGNVGFLPDAGASWEGSWYFARQHWLLNGLPVNSVLGWQYQIPHLGTDVGALLLDSTPTCPMDAFIGYGRNHEPCVAIGDCVIQYGNGIIVLPALPGLRNALVTTNAEITQPVAQMMLGDALRAMPASVPLAPTDLAAVPGNAQVSLSWNPAFGGVTYNVKRATTSGGPYVTIASNLTALCFQDTGLGNNITSYYYVVSAVNAQGEGANSSEVSALPQVWPGIDIGAVGVAGSTSQTGDVITVNGSGSDIYYTADAFQFAPQQVTGDCDIRALVDSVEDTDPWAKAGVMIRETLNPGSANIAMVMSYGNGEEIQYRTNTAGNTSTADVSGKVVPYWVRLTRTSNTFAGYMSPDGTNWTQVGSTQTITMNSNTYVGLAVTSHNNNYLCTATFTKVSIVSLPSPWQTADIGNPGVTGSAIYPNGIFTLFGSGSDIYSTADAFRYVYLPGSGDCDVRARVLTVGNTDPWAKAGVMIRETLNPNAVNIATVVTPGNGVSFQYRTNTAGNTSETSNSGVQAPYWVRAVRTGNTFAGYMSSDGTNWTQVGTTQTIGMSTNIFIGLPMSSHNNSYLSIATFTGVMVSSNLNNTISSPINLTLTKSVSGNMSIQWPYNGNMNGVGLCFTPSLTPPITWTLVTNSPVLSSNQWSITLPSGTNAGFYRLSPAN